MGNVILMRKCLLCRRSCIRGLVIDGHLICAACESRLVNLTCDDPAYDALRLPLKKLCRSLIRTARPFRERLPLCTGHGRIRVGY